MGRRVINLPFSVLMERGIEGVRLNRSNELKSLHPHTGIVSHVAVVESPIWDSQTPLLEPETIQTPFEQKDKGWIVTVYDNAVNTYMEVITILMLATKCDAEEAQIETWEIDNLGQSVVHSDSEENCLEAAKIIATIGIRVEATPDPLA